MLQTGLSDGFLHFQGLYRKRTQYDRAPMRATKQVTFTTTGPVPEKDLLNLL